MKVVINGYHPGSMLKTVLNKITSELNKMMQNLNLGKNCTSKFFSIHDQSNYIKHLLSSSIDFPFKQIVIVINSLDKSSLRNEDFLAYLTLLAKC